ncbi:F-box protein SKIP23-like [Telopea speciosissima]|uniref:F-box protein SKIP23-like n=1 Tax=Telopea speciosissima TaxID=54955 RepID=UPI001CC4DDE6|nr:F-box protein SKIP23-like [Telopea speciosissima]
MASSSMGWSELLPELMELILDRLTSLSDHLRFASVCSSWRSSVVSNRCPRRHRLLPFLMLPPADKEKDNNTTKIRPFFNLSSRKKIDKLHIPEIQNKWCCGSSQGWLLTVDAFKCPPRIQLFNPVTRDSIQLPSVSKFTFQPRKYPPPQQPSSVHYIHKAVLSSDPYSTDSSYIVVVIVTNQRWLAYWKPGADRWSTIDDEQWVCFEDIIFYKGLLYAVSNHGHVVTYDFTSSSEKTNSIPIPIPIGKEISGWERRICDMSYLVESLGELFLVLRHYKWRYEDDEEVDIDNSEDADYYKDIVVHPPFKSKTIKFWVRKLDDEENKPAKWIPIQSIGDDRILFLGNNSSISVSAQEFEFPECCCKGNSIYFNDDHDYGPFEAPQNGYHDMGVFNFETRRVESFLDDQSSSPPPILRTPTFWFTPGPIGSASINFICKLFNVD